MKTPATNRVSSQVQQATQETSQERPSQGESFEQATVVCEMVDQFEAPVCRCVPHEDSKPSAGEPQSFASLLEQILPFILY